MSHTVRVTMGDRGRLVLPASVRSALKLGRGSQLLLTLEGADALRLTPYRTIAERNRGLYADRAGAASAVDALLAERREEARRER